MGMDGTVKPRSTRRLRPICKNISVAAIAVGIATAIALTLLYYPASPFRERHVSYEYTVIIEPDAVGQFAVVCSLPADYGGTVNPNVLSSMIVEGDVTISKVTTPYGDGLEVVGTGSAAITWGHHFTYRTSTQNMYDHCSNLSMLDIGYRPGNAFVHLEGASASFSLMYSYSHVYGNLGADFLRYQVTGNLTTGWNTLPVDFRHMVS